MYESLSIHYLQNETLSDLWYCTSHYGVLDPQEEVVHATTIIKMAISIYLPTYGVQKV